MSFRTHPLAYLAASVTGILAAGLFAAPALAEDSADLAIDAGGTTIAVGAPGKTATVSLINKSKVDASAVLVGLDISKLDTTKVDIDENGCNARADGVILCGIEGGVLSAGEDVDWGFPLARKGDATGDAGEITAFISHEGVDPDESNNEVTVKVKVEGTGPDLTVVAPDVKDAVRVKKNGEIEIVGDLHAGDTAELVYFIWNQGDVAIDGFKLAAKLPKGVTFAGTDPGCEYDAGRTSIACTWDFNWRPQKECDVDPDLFCGGDIRQLLKVSEDVKPGALTGGMVSVEPILPTEGLGAQAGNQPLNVTQLHSVDVDPTDNNDGFAVIVAAEGGAGGGAGGNDDGGLPVTGARAGLIGGVGVAVLAAGGALFLVARRRRVVLVTPSDEKPDA